MLKLKNKDVFFNLKILDYEFIEADYEEDSEWLNISIEVEDGHYCWNAFGAYLRFMELQEMHNWLVNIYKEKDVDRLSFTENELSFNFDSNNQSLSVFLDFDLHPKGQDYNYTLDEEYELKFYLKKSEIKKMMNSIKSEINKFSNAK